MTLLSISSCSSQNRAPTQYHGFVIPDGASDFFLVPHYWITNKSVHCIVSLWAPDVADRQLLRETFNVTITCKQHKQDCYLFLLVLLWQEDCLDHDLSTADSMQSGVPVVHIEMVFHHVCLQHPCSIQVSANEQHKGHVQSLLPSEVAS